MWAESADEKTPVDDDDDSINRDFGGDTDISFGGEVLTSELVEDDGTGTGRPLVWVEGGFEITWDRKAARESF